MANGPYQWNARAARYRDPVTGRFISRDTVRQVVDQVIQASQSRVRTATEALRRGSIDLGEWDRVMRLEIKRTQLETSALLRGGWKQMTPSDYGRVGANVRAQYQYLDGFVKDIRAARVRADGTLFNRANMYPASARVAFHEQQTEQLGELGYTRERNILHPAEHCDDCFAMSALGWVPLGTLIPIGQRQCLGNDKCTMRYQ